MAQGFREAVLAKGGARGGFGHSGSGHAPFDARDGGDLAGGSGSHPLARWDARELLTTSTERLDGRIVLPDHVLVGEGVRGRVELAALEAIDGRAADLRLVGVKLAEVSRSRTEHRADGSTDTEHWVEVRGEAISELAFGDFPIPTRLAAGELFALDFEIPAPRLGPPSTHLGVALIAWAVEVHWDISMGRDERVAELLVVRQHPDYAAVGGGADDRRGSLTSLDVDGATLAIASPLPARIGEALDVQVTWPGAGSGRGGRIELQADIRAPHGVEDVVLASTPVDPATMRGGARVSVPIPPDAPPSGRYDDLEVRYVLRALVDRPLRPDLAVERPVSII